jgi:hypothetical protein
MPPKNRVTPAEGNKVHMLPPSCDRANLRSETPMGFAYAVCQANARHEAPYVGTLENQLAWYG